MGLENRDYYRETGPSYGGGGSFGGGSRFGGGQWAIKYLLIANIAVFLLQNVNPRVTDWLALRVLHQTSRQTAVFTEPREDAALPKQLPAGHRINLGRRAGEFVQVNGGFWLPRDAVQVDRTALLQIWRFLTYGFCHGSLTHILFNMYFLWLFGRMIEPIYGSREFLAFYFASIVASGAAYLIVQAFDASASLIGASGGVMAVTIAAAMTYPRQKLLLMFVIPVEFRWLAVAYVVMDLTGWLQGGSNVAHMAHLGGAAFGFLYKLRNWRLSPLLSFSGLSLPRFDRVVGSRRKVKIHEPSQDDVEERVDTLLAKIQREGEASLTDEEREFLRKASQRYRNR